jgi:hypothetical protein
MESSYDLEDELSVRFSTTHDGIDLSNRDKTVKRSTQRDGGDRRVHSEYYRTSRPSFPQLLPSLQHGFHRAVLD